MSSVKTRLALAGGKYLVTHPRGRITRFVVRLAVRRLSGKIVAATRIDAVSPTRDSRLMTVVGVAAVAGGIVLIVRRTSRPSAASPVVTVPSPHAPFPPAAATPTEAAAPPTVPPAPPDGSPQSEASAVDRSGDDALVVRVKAKLFGGIPPLGVTVESHSGVVTLRGRVADSEDEGRLVRNAEQVEGVRAVQSELQTAGAEPGPTAS